MDPLMLPQVRIRGGTGALDLASMLPSGAMGGVSGGSGGGGDREDLIRRQNSERHRLASTSTARARLAHLTDGVQDGSGSGAGPEGSRRSGADRASMEEQEEAAMGEWADASFVRMSHPRAQPDAATEGEGVG
jgi:hypothetical protein